MVTNVMAMQLNFYGNIGEDRHAAYIYICICIYICIYICL